MVGEDAMSTDALFQFGLGSGHHISAQEEEPTGPAGMPAAAYCDAGHRLLLFIIDMQSGRMPA